MAEPQRQAQKEKHPTSGTANVARNAGATANARTFRGIAPASEGPCAGCAGGNCEACRLGGKGGGLGLSSIDLSSLDVEAIVADKPAKKETPARDATAVPETALPVQALYAKEQARTAMVPDAAIFRHRLAAESEDERRRRQRRSEGSMLLGLLAERQWEEWLAARAAISANAGNQDEDEVAVPRSWGYSHGHLAAGQRKRERARLKELGNRMSADEKRRLAALEEEILKKQMQLEALRIKNLENALSALECPAAS